MGTGFVKINEFTTQPKILETQQENKLLKVDLQVSHSSKISNLIIFEKNDFILEKVDPDMNSLKNCENEKSQILKY